MRATEKTYYNIRRLHVWMALSSLALLAVTVWMIVADHRRPWKEYQRTFRDRIAPWMTRAEIARLTGDLQQADAAERAALDRLKRSLAEQEPNLGKELLRQPLIDALGRPLAVDQIWLPELTIDYNFRQVARFDRCVTCHQAIDQSHPVIASEQTLTLTIPTPPQPAAVEEPNAEMLKEVYGLVLAEEGILEPGVPTVEVVLPETPAADALLRTGDVIVEVNGQKTPNRSAVREQLLANVEWGMPATLSVRRGLPQPYCSHPRSDLFVGSQSPHPLGEFGCTICHDGQGSATSFKWASHTPNDPLQGRLWRDQYDWSRNPHWEFPMLPKRFDQSRCLKCHHTVTDLGASRRFPDPPAAKLLAGYDLIRRNGCFGCHRIDGFNDVGRSVGPDMRLEPNYAEAAQGLLADAALGDQQRELAGQVIARPGEVEPRERLIDSLLDEAGRTPLPRLTPGSRALLDVLASEPLVPGTMRKVGPSLRNVAGKLKPAYLTDWIAAPARQLPDTRMPQFFDMHEHLEGRGRADAVRFEAVEIRAIAAYLLAEAEPVEPPPTPQGVTEPPSAERGRKVFQLQGCLACHRHADFPEADATEGPDLTNLAAKYDGPSGRRWLVGWIRDPIHYSPRTRMPNALLEPVPLPVETGETEDAPAEAGEVRLADPAADVAAYLIASAEERPPKTLPPENLEDLDELALLHLSRSFPKPEAEKFLTEGIPAEMAHVIKGDAAILLGEMTTEKKRLYVGRRTIAKRGCYGCHDVPGFEDAQPIGPALTDFGRKRESLLAFEQIGRYIQKSGAGPEEGFYREALLAHRREGFLWQKLREPRSFDYQMVDDKPYNERLTMGRFNFTAAEREAVATFVLGLVAEPPSERYVYQPDARAGAIAEGRKVLDKYACARCHALEMERWALAFSPDDFEPPPSAPDFAFLTPRLPVDELAASLELDNRGLAHAELVGMPQVDADGQLAIVDDDEDALGNEVLMYAFSLWEPTAILGEVCRVGGADVLAWDYQIAGRQPPDGGALARLLFPAALADARTAGSTAAGMEAWGWVPPSLVHEGAAVQPAWLHDYLLNPTVIRPAAVLRMPRYNLSSAEAGKLVDYFAAMAGVDFPYATTPIGTLDQLDKADPSRPGRLEDAMNVLLDRETFCAKCHLIGNYRPNDQTGTTLAPNLDRVGRRLRPEYIRRWLANPTGVLPYTAMPVNFPPTGEPLGQDLLPGSSLEQIDTVTDLLIHYDEYLSRRVSIEPAGESDE